MSKAKKKDKKFDGTLWGFCWQSTSRTISYDTLRVPYKSSRI